MSRDGQRRNRQRGFTLVEVLVSMTLLAFLTTLVFEGLRFGARSWDHVRTHSAQDQRLAHMHAFLRARIGAVTPPPNPAGQAPLPALARTLLQGTDRSMAFRATWAPRFADRGRFVFALWHDAERRTVVLSWKPELGPALPGESGERVLLEDVAEASFAYFGGSPGTQPAAWHDGWTGAGGLPLLVRISTGPDAPDLQIAIPASG